MAEPGSCVVSALKKSPAVAQDPPHCARGNKQDPFAPLTREEGLSELDAWLGKIVRRDDAGAIDSSTIEAGAPERAINPDIAAEPRCAANAPFDSKSQRKAAAVGEEVCSTVFGA
jgi:hypothetical protein